MSGEVQNLRREAQKLGLVINKKDDGYMIVDAATNAVVAGGTPIPYALTFDQAKQDIEERLRLEDHA